MLNLIVRKYSFFVTMLIEFHF